MRAEHYREAEKLLNGVVEMSKAIGEGVLPIGSGTQVLAIIDRFIARAQVHAMLAACPIEGGYPGDYGVEQ